MYKIGFRWRDGEELQFRDTTPGSYECIWSAILFYGFGTTQLTPWTFMGTTGNGCSVPETYAFTVYDMYNILLISNRDAPQVALKLNFHLLRINFFFIVFKINISRWRFSASPLRNRNFRDAENFAFNNFHIGV